MRVRLQHVSNSSTSSVIIAGFDKEDVDINEFKTRLQKAREVDDINRSDDLYDEMCDKMHFLVVGGESFWNEDFEHLTAKEIGAGAEIGSTYNGSLQKMADLMSDEKCAREEVISKLNEFGIKVKDDATMHFYILGTAIG